MMHFFFFQYMLFQWQRTYVNEILNLMSLCYYEVKYSNKSETHVTPIHMQMNPSKELTRNWSEIAIWSEFSNQSQFTSGLM